MLSIHRSLAIVLALSGAVVAQPARAATPDASGFDVPLLPEPAGGFGADLEQACAVLQGTGPTPKVTLRAAAAAPVPAHDVDIPVGLHVAPGDAANLPKLEGTVTRLSAICSAIVAVPPTLTAADLASLRVFLSSGSMPSLAKALVKASATGAAALTPTAAELAAAIRVEDGKLASDSTSSPAGAGFENILLNGLADFLVTRSKEEAILYLQDEIATRFCTVDGKRILPSTCSAITQLDSTLSIAAMGAALNAAAKRDLVQLPNGVLVIAAERDANNFYIYESLRLAYSLVLEVRGGRLPQEVARSLYALPLRACEQKAGAVGADKECQLVFRAFRISSALMYAAQGNGIDQVYSSLGTRRERVVGTLLEAEFRYSTPFGALPPGDARKLEFTPVQLNTLSGILGSLGEVLRQWKQRQNSLTSPADSKSTPDDRKRLLGTALFDTMIRLSQMVTKLAPEVVTTPATLQQVVKSMSVVRDSANIGRSVVTEDYASIPLDVGNVLTHLEELNLPKDVKLAIVAAQKFVPIATELASARSSADVASALSNAASPADSYRAKYQRPTIGLGALVGGFFGGETLNDPNNDALGNMIASPAFAGFAPVGFQGSVPFGNHFYGGLVLSVIDLGALTTARFKKEISGKANVAQTPNVTISQVFSPGLYFKLGLCKSPIVIGGGASFAPSLRTLEATDMAGTVTAKETVSAIRYGGFLAMDVSILSL